MITYLNRLTTTRQFSAVLGTTEEEFKKLLPVFSSCINEKKYLKKQKNLKKGKTISSQGNPELLGTDADKLVFILYYMKNYPTFDVMGFNFNMGKSTAENYVKTLLPVLYSTQEQLKVLPKDEIKTPEELSQLTDNLDIIADATERSHYRHKDYDTQKNILVENKKTTH